VRVDEAGELSAREPLTRKGINEAIAAGVKETQNWTQLHKANVEPAQKLTVGLDDKLVQLNAMLAKKKKLIQSAKYKTKLAGYETALKALGDVAKKLRLAVTSINPPQNEEQFKKYGLKPADKAQLIKERAGFLPNQIQAFEQKGKDSITHARNAKTFSLSGQMKAVQAMIADAGFAGSRRAVDAYFDAARRAHFALIGAPERAALHALRTSAG
jgi:hypothetical protein